jgi:Tfp pilus assembly protein PilV
LIEVIVSVGIAVILAIALISAGLITNKTARFARNNTQATKLAEQYIEQVRVYRDRRGISTLLTKVNGVYCIDSSSADPSLWDLVTTPCPTVTLNGIDFSRSIIIAETSPSDPTHKKLVSATVTWSESGGTQSVATQTILSLWSAP